MIEAPDRILVIDIPEHGRAVMAVQRPEDFAEIAHALAQRRCARHVEQDTTVREVGRVE